MIFARRFGSKGRTLGFSVERNTLAGWEVREEENDRVVKVVRCHDWHRVESMVALFQLKASELQQDGWQELTTAD
jgi:hypothetical protein